MTNVTWEIIPGYIRTHEDSVRLIADHDDVKIWEIDTDSKRPTVNGYMFGPDDTISVYLTYDEGTLRIDPDATDDTVFKLTGLNGDWTIAAEASRYTVTVFAYKWKGQEEVID